MFLCKLLLHYYTVGIVLFSFPYRATSIFLTSYKRVKYSRV